MYSICTVLRGSSTCSTGFAAALMHSQAISTSSGVEPTGIATAAFLTAPAMVLQMILSSLKFVTGVSSTVSTPRASTAEAIATFSLKSRGLFLSAASCLNV